MRKMRLRVVVVLVVCTLLVGVRGVAGQAERQVDSRQTVPPEERIDINSATVAELVRVPGLTQTWAERIVRFRPYHSKDDLLQRGVVTSQIYDRIKGYVIAHREKK